MVICKLVHGQDGETGAKTVVVARPALRADGDYVARESTRLGGRMRGDPADQQIVATARVHGLRLVTCDERIRRSETVAVV